MSKKQSNPLNGTGVPVFIVSLLAGAILYFLSQIILACKEFTEEYNKPQGPPNEDNR